jgi:hypothetical protein
VASLLSGVPLAGPPRTRRAAQAALLDGDASASLSGSCRHGRGQPDLHRRLHHARLLRWADGCGLFEALHLPLGLVGSGGPLLLLLVGLILVRRGLPHPLPRPALRTWQRAHMGLLAGLLATLGAVFTLDLMVVVAGGLAWRLPGSLLADAAGQLARALARDARSGLLWLVVPVEAGVAWGSVYGAWTESRLAGPDAARGLLFAFVP